MAKKILIGTTNPSKVKRFESLLSGYDIDFLTLKDLNIVEEPQETGRTPEENAVIKAKFYGQYFECVICNDSGLYFDELELDDKIQPGLNVRTPHGKRLDDDEMLYYYSSLVHSLGGKVLAYYLDGIAVYNKGNITSFMDNSEAVNQGAFYMTDKPSKKRRSGWPLDSISLDRNALTYFVDNEIENIILGEYQKRLLDFLVSSLEL